MKNRFFTIGIILAALMFVASPAMAAFIDGAVSLSNGTLTSFGSGGASVELENSSGDYYYNNTSNPATGSITNVNATAQFTTANATASAEIYLNDTASAEVSAGSGGGNLAIMGAMTFTQTFTIDATVTGADADASFGLIIDGYNYPSGPDIAGSNGYVTSNSGLYDGPMEYITDPTDPTGMGMAWVFILDESAFTAAGGTITDTFTATVDFGAPAAGGFGVAKVLTLARGSAVSEPTAVIRLTGDLAFGDVTVGETAQKTLTIWNDGDSALTVTGISLPDGFSGSYSGSIDAGESQDVIITFAPQAAQLYSGDLTVASDKTSGTDTMACSGTGVVPVTRIIRLAGELAFPDVSVGETAQKTLTIWNDGNSTLTITGISLPDGFSGSYSGSIEAGESQDVIITFAPQAAQSYSGNLTVASDKTGGTDTTACSGTGVASPTRRIRLTGDLAFGDVTVGETAQKTLTIWNDGNSTLNITGISLPDGFSGSYSGSIGAGDSQNVTITFAPQAAQTYSGDLTVASDKTSGTDTMACSGTGVASTRIIRLTGDLAFGDVMVGEISQETLTIWNDGNSALTITSISLPDGFSGSFSGSIGAGDSQNVIITFAPLEEKIYSGDLTVASDKTSGTDTMACSGTGVVNTPNQPVLLFPEDMETDVSLTPTLESSPFIDPNDDLHDISHWQINASEDFEGTFILDIETTKPDQLTGLTVPSMILDEDTTYWWRVRYQDDSGDVSPWSEPFSFTTATTGEDMDTNGIPDDYETPSDTDLDHDETEDRLQSNIKTIYTADKSETVGVKFEDININGIDRIESIDEDDIADETGKPENMPFGLIGFRLDVVPGSEVNVTVLFSSALPENATYYKYDPIAGWQDYSMYTTISADRMSVVLQLKDGGFGDSDGVVNGIISDPGGPAVSQQSDDDDIDRGYGGGCFIESLK